MTSLAFPDAESLRTASELRIDDYPAFATVTRDRELDPIEDVPAAARTAVCRMDLDGLPPGAEIGLTAGSRGINDKPAILSAVVKELHDRGYEPFVLAAMGSHGGATADGQRETLAALGITEDTVGCPIRTSMAVESVTVDELGRPVFLAADATAADGIVLINRIKPHTDFTGPVESGLCKMAVVGLGKHRGAESFHNAGLAGDFADVLLDRTERLLEAAPIIGGIAIVEDAAKQATHIEGMAAPEILDREPSLLEMAYDELPTLPVDDLDLLIVDAIGKDISGTCMDTNVLGRYRFHGEPEPEHPQITRVYARSLTGASHGNAVGLGLADFVHAQLIEATDMTDTYINIATSGEPGRAKIPFVVPDDATALRVIPSTLGRTDFATVRIARIRNTLDPDTLVVSEAVATELREHPACSVGSLEPLTLDDQTLPADAYR